MDITQKEKIKNLIEQADILSALEKAQWAGFLDLMDEEQSARFERLLVISRTQGKLYEQAHLESLQHKSDSAPLAGINIQEILKGTEKAAGLGVLSSAERKGIIAPSSPLPIKRREISEPQLSTPSPLPRTKPATVPIPPSRIDEKKQAGNKNTADSIDKKLDELRTKAEKRKS